MEKITVELKVDYSSVRIELLRKRLFLMSPFYMGVLCGCKRCIYPSSICSSCCMNMFNVPFPEVYVNYMNLL